MAIPNNQKINLVSDRGERFSYYQCDDFRIGKGAMGEVFKGWRADNPEHKVAIKKVYTKHSENPHIRRRAKHEASLRIDHPNIVKMLGYCEFDRARGSIYIVSDLVRGNTIKIFCSNIDPSVRVEIVSNMICSVLDALTCLHSQMPPIFHRDIKPSNIMVENGRNVRLMDLGIATSDGVSLGTLDGFIGTEAYASPEQISSARFGKVNATSDIYSLGITFYELLTGINPISEGAKNQIEVFDRQVSMPLPYNEIIPKKLFKVILKATAKEQSHRFQNATDFKDAILEANDDPTPPTPSPQKWLIVAIITIIALMSIIVIILANT